MKQHDALAFAQAYPILYVDDEPDNLLVFRATFRHEFHILTAADGAEALEKIDAHPIAILLTDQRMPGLSGVDLCERVRDQQPHIQRMLVTAYSDRDVAIAAINRGGVSRYVTKPWDVDQLRQLLREAVARAHLERTVRQLRVAILDKERLVGIHAANARLLHDLAHTNASIQACCAKLEEMAPRLADELDAATWAAYHSDLRELRRYVDFLRALQGRGAAQGDDGFAKPQRRLVSVGALLDSAVELARHDFESVARLSVHCPPSASVWADPVDVSRMIINLLRSATSAMREAGRRGCAIAIDVHREGGSTAIVVADDGPAATVGEQTAMLHGGAAGWRGVGLSVARELVLAHGGQLDPVPSDAGWTSWRLTLPAAQPTGPQP